MRFIEFLTEKEKEKKETDKKPVVAKEKSRLAVLMRTHDDQSKLHNRAAQEAQALHKYHRSRGEHELANICKELIEPLQKAATIHRRLHKVYTDRHGEGT